MSATSKRNSDNPSTSTGQHAGDNMDMAVYRDIEPYEIFFDEMSVMAHEGGSDGSAEVEQVDFDHLFALDSNTAKSSVDEVEHVDFDHLFTLDSNTAKSSVDEVSGVSSDSWMWPGP
jgi:hypothetical protein